MILKIGSKAFDREKQHLQSLQHSAHTTMASHCDSLGMDTLDLCGSHILHPTDFSLNHKDGQFWQNAPSEEIIEADGVAKKDLPHLSVCDPCDQIFYPERFTISPSNCSSSFYMHESLDAHFIDHWQEWMMNFDWQNGLISQRVAMIDVEN
jgi:hypothetical protein